MQVCQAGYLRLRSSPSMPAMCTQVLWKRLSLPCEDSRGTDLGHGGCSVVMSDEDVQEHQLALALSDAIVSMSTAVWKVMCEEPLMFMPMQFLNVALHLLHALQSDDLGLDCARDKDARRVTSAWQGPTFRLTQNVVHADADLLDAKHVNQACMLASLALDLTCLMIALGNGCGEITITWDHDQRAVA